MINHGFYHEQAELIDIANPIIALLNGANDSYKANGHADLMRSVIPGQTDTKKSTERYFPN
jgi:hypothetical protein